MVQITDWHPDRRYPLDAFAWLAGDRPTQTRSSAFAKLYAVAV